MKKTLRWRAIRGAWAVARKCGLVRRSHPCVIDSLMDTDERVRHAVVRAWERGYANGYADGRRYERKRKP
mgnify:CR=1 FL=1